MQIDHAFGIGPVSLTGGLDSALASFLGAYLRPGYP